MLLMISFQLLMYSRFSNWLCSLGGKCSVCQSNDFWIVVFTDSNGSTESRMWKALQLYVNLIRFSISADYFCPPSQSRHGNVLLIVNVLLMKKVQIKEIMHTVCPLVNKNNVSLFLYMSYTEISFMSQNKHFSHKEENTISMTKGSYSSWEKNGSRLKT